MDLTNYVDVPTRFKLALDKWPDLRIVESKPEVVTIGDKTFISVTMSAWRTADDPMPCQATCWEPFPGKTSFTRDSEQMNASTSVLGRLLGLMMPFGPKMASAEEVQNRQPDTTSAPATLAKQFERTMTLGANAVEKPPSEGQLALLRNLNYEGPVPATLRECTRLITQLKDAK